MTHLDPFNQQTWLEELYRVLRPGGIAALSVHGEFAAAFAGSAFCAKVAASGIVDHPDNALDGVLPSGYYRDTFQSQDYTIATFAAKLDLLDYRVAGLGGWQDLVVQRKPDSGRKA